MLTAQTLPRGYLPIMTGERARVVAPVQPSRKEFLKWCRLQQLVCGHTNTLHTLNLAATNWAFRGDTLRAP
jgi:hypothetical protein